MNIDEAMQAHVNWKMRLRDYCKADRKENLDSNLVNKDNRCDLGKWIHGEAKEKFGSSPDFQKLIEIHAEFHRYAAEIVNLVNSNKITEALAILDNPQSPFRSKTTEVIGLLAKMKKLG
ncbi:MAG TPA: CZB domain-containing protein [Elusimicrobiota bacterium]|nr:CZB domain-containing protein [Elusimicrobiota bacterium]